MCQVHMSDRNYQIAILILLQFSKSLSISNDIHRGGDKIGRR